MKNVISCLIGLFLLSSCACGDKEPMPTFGEQLEGNWRAFAYKFNGEEIFIWPDDTYLVDFWDFDCKLGATQDTAAPTHVAEIIPQIDALVLGGATSFYVEILAKHGLRKAKPPGPANPA